MKTRLASRIETGVELLASVLLAGAGAFASYALLGPTSMQPQGPLISLAAALVGFLLSRFVFTRASVGATQFRTASFNVPQFEPIESDELVLGDEHRLQAPELVLEEAQSLRPEPLILDDVLAELEPDSRVVRLFDRKAMPTPGQLQSRIDDHLGSRQSAPQDAAQALSDALAELRRSLR